MASIPLDAPTTPSRIPVRARPLLGRPSFASPTKASLSKHHPQVLRRSSSMGAGPKRPETRGLDSRDVSTAEFAGPKHSKENAESTARIESMTPRGFGHRRVRSDGGRLTATPRRMSRSPSKQALKTVEQQGDATDELQENIENPFIKRGLRRSPLAGSQIGGVLQDLLEHDINPFEKRGLRRSPRSSQAVDAVGEILGQARALPQVVISTNDVLPAKAVDASEVSGTPMPRTSEPLPTTQSTEPITVKSFEQHEEAQSALRATDQPTSPEFEKPFVVKDAPQDRQRHLEEASQPRQRSSQAAEPRASNHERLEVPKSSSKTTEPTQATESETPIILPNLQRQKERPLRGNSSRQTRASPASELVTVNRRRPEEPELPPTPIQLGIPDPIVTTPPSGIHDTPSKRARNKSKQKSSPLKPRDPAPVEDSKAVGHKSQPGVNSPKSQSVAHRRSSRFPVPEDPHEHKIEIRDDLLKELQRLQKDLALGYRENEHLRLQYESRRRRSTAPSNADELIDLILRATAPASASEPEPKPKSKSICKSIDAFLPFTSRRQRLSGALPHLDKPIPSHLPIALDDPLPYLQVFSPLVYTSSICLLHKETASADTLLQEADQSVLLFHQIKASHPSGLFSARFSMTVDSSMLSITSLDVDALPATAEKELGTFLRERSHPHPVLKRDIGILCWAMGRWVEVSVSRARFWATIDQDFKTSEARAKSLRRMVRERKRRRSVVLDEEDNADLDGHDGAETKRKWTIKQLLPHMGRTAMELNNDDIELRFEWRIGFDWTGEVESAISATARLPTSCEYVPPSSCKLLTSNYRAKAG